MVDIGSRLRMLRKSKNLTQQQLSKMLGLTKSVISAYETSTRLPSYDILIRIAGIFGVTTDYLLGVSHKQLIDVSSLTEDDSQLVLSLIHRLNEQ